MIIVYTGDGKGKTTAALGLAMRNLGHGNKVTAVHFLKSRISGEFNFRHKNFKQYNFGRKEFVSGKPKHLDFELANTAFEIAKERTKDSQMVILDELNVAVSLGLIQKDDVIEFLKDFPKDKDLIITGRKALPEIIEIADLVTEMKEIKHPFQKGIKARMGIEY